MLDEILYHFSRPLIEFAAHLRFDLDVRWHEALPQGAKIIAPNHPTTTDPFLIGMLAADRVHILIEETLFKVPVLGQYLAQTGHVRVVKDNGRTAYEEAKQLLAAGHTLVIFPEGSISPLEGGFCPPRTGVARLALETGAPVVPVGIHLDRSRIRRIETMVDGKTEVGTWYLAGPYAVTGGRALYFQGDVEDREYVRALSQQVMQQIIDLAREGEQRLHRSLPVPAMQPSMQPG
ncbi:MAG: 1-acyl-sn-glycerol-3-phosphate acyltransferase [Anaerolineae bacterium]|nr:1-acyl-sn-glycerol-3-phosphate acyltransferase [Anaerolineae bacterium]